jgi:hypothetical protein
LQGSVREDECKHASAGDVLLSAPEIAPDAGALTGGRGFGAALRPGTAGSTLIHALAALLLLYGFTAPEPVPASVPVDLVLLEHDTTSPLENVPPQQRASLPRTVAAARTETPPPSSPRTELASLVPPAAPKPLEPIPPSARPVEPVPDALDSKLQALSKLRAPSANPRAGAAANGGGAQPGPGGYSVKDYVRAQVERRWNLDLSELGSREFVIAIRVVLHRDGTVDTVDILDQTRFLGDAVFRSIALSARNAILLSSPIALPAGDYGEVMELTLNLDPRDTVR